MGRLVLRTRSMKRETFARNSESGFTSSSKWARAMVGACRTVGCTSSETDQIGSRLPPVPRSWRRAAGASPGACSTMAPEMRNPYLIGTKVYLRPLEEADAAECHAWLNDPEVRRTLAVRGVPHTEASSREWIRTRDPRRDQVFAIVTRERDLYVGNCGLHEIDPIDRLARLGIVIGRKDEWGKGFGTEAVTLLCRHAFDGLNLHKVCLSCFATNERGLRLYARVGFAPEGRLREQVFIDGRWVDEIVLGLVRDELT